MGEINAYYYFVAREEHEALRWCGFGRGCVSVNVSLHACFCLARGHWRSFRVWQFTGHRLVVACDIGEETCLHHIYMLLDNFHMQHASQQNIAGSLYIYISLWGVYVYEQPNIRVACCMARGVHVYGVRGTEYGVRSSVLNSQFPTCVCVDVDAVC
jgi:hypothetical protein